MILIIQLSFIFSLSCCYCIHCLYARALSFSYTLIRSLLTTLDLHVQILDMFYFSDQVFDEPVHVARSWSLSLLIIGIPALLFMLFLDSIYRIQLPFLSFIHRLSLCLIFICHITMILIYRGRFYTLFRLF